MKRKRKLIASILCLFKPKTNDDVEKDTSLDGEDLPEKRHRRRRFGGFFFRSKSLTSKSTVGILKNPKESSRRILSKIMSSIYSDSSNWGGKLSKLLKRKESGNESFMKASASHDYKTTTFSVSSKTSSCSSSYLSVPSSSALYSPARRTALPSSEEWNSSVEFLRPGFLRPHLCDLVDCHVAVLRSSTEEAKNI